MAATWYGDDSPHLSWKYAQVTGKAGETVKIQVKWAAHTGQDRRLPGVVTHTRVQRATSVRSRVGSSSKTVPGSPSTLSPAGRTLPHGDGSMYSQANVRAAKVLVPPIRALPSVIVVTEKVMREADGPVGRAALTAHFRWKGDRQECASKAGRVSR